jgi:hypothetical protein
MLVAALTIVALTIDLLTGKPERLVTRITDWSFTTFAVPLAGVGALIAARRPGNRVGALLLIGGLSISVEKVAEELTSYGVRHPGAVPGLGLIGWVSNLAWVPAVLALLLLPALFPDGQPPSPRWRPVVWAIVTGAVVSVVDPHDRHRAVLAQPAGATRPGRQGSGVLVVARCCLDGWLVVVSRS